MIFLSQQVMEDLHGVKSPTFNTKSLILSTIVSNNWNLKSIDIKKAFLQGQMEMYT